MALNHPKHVFSVKSEQGEKKITYGRIILYYGSFRSFRLNVFTISALFMNFMYVQYGQPTILSGPKSSTGISMVRKVDEHDCS